MKILFILLVLSLPFAVSAVDWSQDYLQKKVITGKDQEAIEWSIKGKLQLRQVFSQSGVLLSETEWSNGRRIERNFDLKLQTMRAEHFENGILVRSEKWKLEEAERKIEIRIPATQSLKEQVYNQSNPVMEPASQSDLCEPSEASLRHLRGLQGLGGIFAKFSLTGKDGIYYRTSLGIKIDQTCLKTYGNQFPFKLQASLQKSLACLKDLRGPGSDQNLAKLISLLENQKNPLKINCSSEKKWSKDVEASATIPGDAGFPLIQLNSVFKINEEVLYTSIFHEMLHNCGHIHGSSIEYMYVCPKCCFDKPKNEIACKICRGNYTSTRDMSYLRDLVEWSNQDEYILARRQLVSQIFQESKPSLEKIKLLAQAMSSPELSATVYRSLHQSGQGAWTDASLEKKMQIRSEENLGKAANYFADALRLRGNAMRLESVNALELGASSLPSRVDTESRQTDQMRSLYRDAIQASFDEAYGIAYRTRSKIDIARAERLATLLKNISK